MYRNVLAKMPSLFAIGFFALGLAACSDPNASASDNASANGSGETVTVNLGGDNTVDLRDGPLGEVNACMERNNTDAILADANRTACAWAYSVPFAGTPPGVKGILNYDWPQVVLTLENNNPLILLTGVCVQIQFDVSRVIQNACSAIVVGPMDRGATAISLQTELSSLGIDGNYELNLEAFQWSVTSVRYLQILEPTSQEE